MKKRDNKKAEVKERPKLDEMDKLIKDSANQIITNHTRWRLLFDHEKVLKTDEFIEGVTMREALKLLQQLSWNDATDEQTDDEDFNCKWADAWDSDYLSPGVTLGGAKDVMREYDDVDARGVPRLYVRRKTLSFRLVCSGLDCHKKPTARRGITR